MRVRPENPFSTYMVSRAEASAIVRAFGVLPPDAAPADPLLSALPDQGDAGADRARQAQRQSAAAVRMTCIALGLVVLLHAWILSAGWVTPWPQYSTYYNRLGEAFARGQASLVTQPSAAHLALPDPYDPETNRPFRRVPGVHDAVLFNGKLYLYWGPVPAMLLVPLKAAFHLPVIGDEWLVFAFAIGTMLCTALLLLRTWERFFSDQPAWTLFLAVLVAGLATPMSFLMARAAVYEAAILAGQFFLLAGIYLLFTGTRTRAAGDDADAQPGARRLFLAGTCLSLAVGSRVSLAIAVIALGALVTFRIVRAHGRPSRRLMLARVGAFALPLFIGAAALAAYNHARFGDPLEFGQRYQLTGKNYRATPHLMSPAHIAPSLFSYALRPLEVGGEFPFVVARTGDGTFPRFLPLPEHYESNEQIAGLLLVSPFVWLAAIPLMHLARALRQRLRTARSDTASPQCENAERRDLHWLLFCVTVAAALAFAPILFAIGSTMRYLADLTPCLMVLATIGIWLRGQKLADAPHRRRVFFSVAVTLGVYSIVIGMLLAVTGYYGHFRSFNPRWFNATAQMLGTPQAPAE